MGGAIWASYPPRGNPGVSGNFSHTAVSKGGAETGGGADGRVETAAAPNEKAAAGSRGLAEWRAGFRSAAQ